MNKRGGKKFAAFVAFALLSSVLCHAQGDFMGKYTEGCLNMEDGLPSNFVDDLLIDDAGFLWIVTSGGGLTRYDGSELLSLNQTSGLSSNFTRCIVEDPFRRLWVASEGGLDVLDLRTLQTVDLKLDLHPETFFCSYVTQDSKGNIWAKFGKTLYWIQLNDRGDVAEIRRFTHPGLEAANYVFEDVDGDGSVWAPLDGYLYKIIPDQEKNLISRRVAPNLFLGEKTYVSDYLVSDATVWISTENGLYLLSKATGEWKQYVSSTSDPHSLTQNFVTSLAQTDDGQLLVSTLFGLNVYNPVNDTFDRVGTDVINCVKVKDNYVFIATETQGLKYLTPRRLNCEKVSHVMGDPSSLPAGAVNAIWQDLEKRLWVGTVEGGISIREPGSSSFSHVTRARSGLAHNSVSALRPGADGQMFAGTWGGGIDVVQDKAPYKVLSHLPSLGSQLDYVGALEYDRESGLLWIGSNQGIYIWDAASRTYLPALDEQPGGCIGSCIDSHHRLWMGGYDGVYIFDLNQRQEDGRYPYVHLLPGEKICAVLEAGDRSIFLGSNGGGIYRAVVSEDNCFAFQAFSMANGLSSDRIRGFCEDPEHHIWVSTEHGLNRIDLVSGVIETFYKRDGLETDRFHWNNACQGTDGKLYFGQSEGFLAVDPAFFPDRVSQNGPLRLTCVSVGDDQEYRDPFLPELRLHERDRNIRFSFTTLDESESTIYQYRLEGYEAGWFTLSKRRQEAVYSVLPGGRYVFQVRSYDLYGRQLGTLSLPVYVRSFFYHTWWFRALVVFLVLCLGWLILVWRTRVLKRRQVALEQIVEERTREISAQKRLVEKTAEELQHQNEVLLHQNEELASRKMLTGQQEDPFKEKAVETLRNLYKDPDLDVTSFSRAMGMSKTLLNNRLQECFGQSIGQFIRAYRLTLAREMLESGSGVIVSEVAYEVGFNDPKYFTRCFTKEFGVAPSAVSKR